MFNVDLARSDVAAQPIAEGNTLDVCLAPVESDKNFLRMDYQFSIKDEVVDSATNVTIADINLDARDGFKMTFRAINDPFTAKIHMPMDLNTAALRGWFDAHPDADEVKEYFNKSSGTYNQVGDFGEGYFMYNPWLYDVYFLTEEGPNVDDPRGEPYTQSMQQATVPENIILEVPAGTELTAEQQAKIDAAGGLNKTVGKGFKLRVKNFKGIGRTEGGYMTLVYYLDIVNPSPEMDANGIPNYRNTASLYAQEIPNCGNDEVCDPLEFEKTTIEDINEGNPVTMKVRDVTNDGNAEGLSQATFCLCMRTRPPAPPRSRAPLPPPGRPQTVPSTRTAPLRAPATMRPSRTPTWRQAPLSTRTATPACPLTPTPR